MCTLFVAIFTASRKAFMEYNLTRHARNEHQFFWTGNPLSFSCRYNKLLTKILSLFFFFFWKLQEKLKLLSKVFPATLNITRSKSLTFI